MHQWASHPIVHQECQPLPSNPLTLLRVADTVILLVQVLIVILFRRPEVMYPLCCNQPHSSNCSVLGPKIYWTMSVRGWTLPSVEFRLRRHGFDRTPDGRTSHPPAVCLLAHSRLSTCCAGDLRSAPLRLIDPVGTFCVLMLLVGRGIKILHTKLYIE